MPSPRRLLRAARAASGWAPGRARDRDARAAHEWTDVPVPAFLIRHPGVGPILVDTGLHPSVAHGPQRQHGPLMRPLTSARGGRRRHLAAAGRGVAPATSRSVILTHLHLDHASAMSEFPESIFVVSARNGEEATEHPKLGTATAPAITTTPSTSAQWTSTATHRVLRAVRPHFRPVRRRVGPPRLHSRPQRRPHVGDRRLPRRDFVSAVTPPTTGEQFQGESEPLPVARSPQLATFAEGDRAYRETYPYALIVPGHDPSSGRSWTSATTSS